MGQLRKFTVQSRVQDGRDGEWDAFAREETDDLDNQFTSARTGAKKFPWSSNLDDEGQQRRSDRNRMPSDQGFGSQEHYRTGSKQLDQD